jgi:CPA1 family monovalent cation:H+ antiporter
MQGYAEPSAIGRMLLIAILAGLLLGAVGGTVGAIVLRYAPDDLTAILASLVAVFATSLLTEHLHGSAVIAVVVAGLLVGHEMRVRLEPSRVLALQGFWEVAAFVINVWLFLLIGIQLSGDMLVREAWPIVLAVIALHVGRAVAVYGCFGALHLSGQGVPWRWQHVMVFGNVKGALSMAAVLALPADTPYRDRLIAIVFGVTLVSLLTQALPFRRFLTWIGVSGRPEPRDVDNSRAVLIAARRAQLELDQLLAAGLMSRQEHAERRAAFQRDIIAAEATLRNTGLHSHGDIVVPAVLIAQKAAILDAARRGLITERTAGERVAALDAQFLEVSAGEYRTEHQE